MHQCIESKRKTSLLKSENIFLRTLQSNDVEDVLAWENDTKNWGVSGTQTPFTKDEIEKFVNSEHDIQLNLQIRYVICLNKNNQAIGTIDLFDLNPQDQHVGVGLLIASSDHRKKGYATEALTTLIDYCRNELSVVHVFCNIQKDNLGSIRLFEKLGFEFIEEQKLFKNNVNHYELIL